MEVVYGVCCGLDVHAKSVVACLIRQGRKQTRTFGAMTRELLELRDWLVSEGCTHVAMEATGVYWKPVFNILEGAVDVKLVNAPRSPPPGMRAKPRSKMPQSRYRATTPVEEAAPEAVHLDDEV